MAPKPADNLLMAGGTGGHIFPALALAEALKSQGESVAWLGSQHSMEAERVPASGIPFYALSVKGLRGQGWRKRLLAPFILLRSLWQAWCLLRRIKPRRVIGFGGFASGPGGLAAWLLGIPVYIHEQNALPGMTNRVLARLSRRVFTAFPQAFADHPRGFCVGNPIRADLLDLPPPSERFSDRSGPMRLLIVGGSLGARILNQTLPQTWPLLSASAPVTIYHQAGRGQSDAVHLAYQQAGCVAADIRVADFVEDMAEAYAWADLVICRAGALTVSELAAVGLPAILIPFPFAVDDHQTHNARYLSQAGAAVLMPQAELTPESLAQVLQPLLKDRQSLSAMADAARQLAQPLATQTLLNELNKDAE